MEFFELNVCNKSVINVSIVIVSSGNNRRKFFIIKLKVVGPTLFLIAQPGLLPVLQRSLNDTL